MERRRFLIVKRRVKGQPPLAGIFARLQPLKGLCAKKISKQSACDFLPGAYGSACVQHAEPSLAETKYTANNIAI